MKVAIGCDHAGFTLKEKIKKYLSELKIQFFDFGTFSEEPVDYPDIVFKIAEAVSKKDYDFGILICGTGIGMSITANKFLGIKAALCSDPLSSKYARSHTNANILCIGERIIGQDMACEIVRTFLTTEFSGGRHQRRVEKIEGIEQKILSKKSGK